MKQTILSKKEGPLLTHAISKLRPGIFSHPVWVRFGNKDRAIPPETIRNLFIEADHLQRDSPGDACEVLLICAVYQNYSGQRTNALITLQKALDLAERTGLAQQILWAIWGACAVCVQQGNYEQAAMHLGHLQSALYEQNEWMLADYIDVFKELLPCYGINAAENCRDTMEYQEFGPLLTSTFDWLNQWGYSAQPVTDEHSNQLSSGSPSQGLTERSWYPTKSQQGPWQTLKLIFQGELKIHWMRSGPAVVKHRSSFWGFILRSLRIDRSDRKIDDPILDVAPHGSTSCTGEKATESFSPVTSSAGQYSGMGSNSTTVIPPQEETVAVIPVSAHMLGKFEMSIHDVPCRLPTSRSLSLLKYLMLNHKQNTPRDTLMDIFWPDATAATARNNLNVAMHGIRRALRQVSDESVIIYEDGAYCIAPDVQIWLDVEEFERLVNMGKRLESRNQLAAISEYEAAVSIYQGDFLQENLYEGWTVLTRESLRMAYLKTLDSLSQIYFHQEHYAACISTCQLILARDSCREDAHCMLMRCYNHQGQDHLALRQYQACVQALRTELEVAPAPATTELYQQIRQHARV